MDLFEDDSADAGATTGSNAPEFSVSEISGAIKKTLEGSFGRVRVRGEVGRVITARSGHMYFDVKDDRSVLSCTSWKGQVAKLSVVPEEGLEVIVTGRLTAYGAQSRYNLNVDEVEVAGEGALMAMLEKRKKALAAEGLFAQERKQKLPYLPEIIGVVTSPTGAVIRDILHRLRDRFPRKVLIWPVAVQGANCAPEVTRAIQGFNALTPGGALPRPDVIIVARGGGSIEDLWGFNEESVARAAAASEIPLISAVGHETDTTLIDFVSDQRAPTPTAAAEMAVPVRLDLLGWVETMGGRLASGAGRTIEIRGQRLRDLARALPRPNTLLETPRQRLDFLEGQLPAALLRFTQTKRLRLSEASAALRPRVLRTALSDANRRLEDRSVQLGPALRRGTERGRDALATRSARLAGLSPAMRLAQNRKDLDALGTRAHVAMDRQLTGSTERLQALARLRETLGYQATLARGYAVVREGESLVTSAKIAQKAGALEIEFADGRVHVPRQTGKTPSKPKKDVPPKPQSGSDQGSLF
ncbi:MAG: exodeoxyribonuclease VII large subunit [Pseudomonadota bacterium]